MNIQKMSICDRLAVAASQNKSALGIDSFFEEEKRKDKLIYCSKFELKMGTASFLAF